jgi:O-antigen/teichoic acid export membrane protein
MSRARRLVFSGFWIVGINVLTATSQLIVVPFFIQYWGDAYKDWIALSALTFILQYADGGMQQHIINTLTTAYTQERWDDLRVDVASATLMYTFTSLLVLVGTAGVCTWISVTHHFQGRALESQAVAVMALLGVQVMLALLQGYLGGLYRAFGRYDIPQAVGFFTRFSLLLGMLAVLTRGHGAVAMAAMLVGVNSCFALFQFFDTRRREPRLGLTYRGASLSRARSFVDPSLRYLLIAMSQGLTQSGTLLVIDAIDPPSLVIFSTTRVVANAVRQIMNLFSNTVYPELTRLDALGARDRLAKGVRIVVKLTCSITLPIIAALCFAGPELYRAWTNGQAPDVTLLRLLLLDVALGTPWASASIVLVATSRVRDLSNMNLFGALALLGLSYPAMKFFGVEGIGLVSLALTACVYGVLAPRWSQEVVGETWLDFARDVYARYAVLALLTLLAAWGAHHWLVPWSEQQRSMLVRFVAGHPKLARFAPAGLSGALVGMVALGCSAPISWFFFLQRPERALIERGVRQVLARRRPEPQLNLGT